MSESTGSKNTTRISISGKPKKSGSTKKRKAGSAKSGTSKKAKKSLRSKILDSIPSRKSISKILTEHPLGKKGVTMAFDKYEKVRAGILEAIHHLETPTYPEIVDFLKAKWGNSFKGSIPGLTEVVKLDLEARKLIKKLMTKPERYQKD
jgi:hypothetical protein